jgi:hypothetical protein
MTLTTLADLEGFLLAHNMTMRVLRTAGKWTVYLSPPGGSACGEGPSMLVALAAAVLAHEKGRGPR